MILLQTPYQFFAKPDPTQSIVAISILSLFLVIFLIYAFLTSRSSSKPGTFSKRAFRKKTKKLGLSREQTHLLEFYLKATKYLSPNRIFENAKALDAFLRKALAWIEAQNFSEEEKDRRKFTLYQIRQTIEANTKEEKILSSTLSLPLHTEVTIKTPSGESYPSYITSNMQSMLGLECPIAEEKGKGYPWKKDEELGIVIVRGGTEVYAFKTKVLGYKRVRGVLSVFVAHGKNLKQIQKRKYRRKEISKPAIFYPVDVVESTKGREIEKQAVVNRNKRSMGNLQDISAGGCALMTRTPLAPGKLIRLEFETEKGKSIVAYGKVKGVTKIPRGGIMHIQFTNVSRQHLTKILDFVYEYIPTSASGTYA
ncbi:MAG: PilZ domain-containing protein [Spirochaetales bacterium]